MSLPVDARRRYELVQHQLSLQDYRVATHQEVREGLGCNRECVALVDGGKRTVLADSRCLIHGRS